MHSYTRVHILISSQSFGFVFQRKENSVTEDMRCVRYIHAQFHQTHHQWECGNEKAVTVCPMSESVHRGVGERDKNLAYDVWGLCILQIEPVTLSKSLLHIRMFI